MSFCARPIVAANSAVAAPMIATMNIAVGACVINRRAAHDHVNAGGDHRRGVNQRRHRRRAGHRVGQPNVQRNLRALAGGADEQQNGDRSNAAGEDRMPGKRIDAACLRSVDNALVLHAVGGFVEETDRAGERRRSA